MAYVSQELKKKIAQNVKRILKEYQMRGSLGVNNYSTLVLKLKEGPLDLLNEFNKNAKRDFERRGLNDAIKWEDYAYANVNPYSIERSWEGKNLEFLTKIKDAMNGVETDEQNYNNSDIMTDYFDVGWYIKIAIGTWEKPYKHIKWHK